MVRAHAQEWGIDPHKIGMLRVSRQVAELVAPAALAFDAFDKAERRRRVIHCANVSSRPDFVGLVYPGPTPVRTRRCHARPGQCTARVHHLRGFR